MIGENIRDFLHFFKASLRNRRLSCESAANPRHRLASGRHQGHRFLAVQFRDQGRANVAVSKAQRSRTREAATTPRIAPPERGSGVAQQVEQLPRKSQQVAGSIPAIGSALTFLAPATSKATACEASPVGPGFKLRQMGEAFAAGAFDHAVSQCCCTHRGLRLEPIGCRAWLRTHATAQRVQHQKRRCQGQLH